MPARTFFWFALTLGFALLAGAGCELIVDFDRSKIPMAGSDAPTGPDGSTEPDDDAGLDEGADEDAGD